MGKKKEIIKLIEEALDEVKIIHYLNESKFSKVANTMRGLVPSIKTIAIMTAQNPYGKKHSDEFNRKANLKLMLDLKNGQYGYRSVLGQYGYKEDSFIINNISMEDAIRLGDKYKQESIVFGRRVEEDEGYIGMKFNLISTMEPNIGNIEGEMDVFINLENPDDFYTEYGGRKFVIPFYGITKMIVDMNNNKKIVTHNYDDTKWDGGKVTPSDISIEDVDDIEKLQEDAMKSIGSSAYHKRGLLRKKLRSLGLE